MLRELIQQKKVIFVTGKGGVGKTTVCVGLAQMAAQLGRRVCIVESSFIDQIAPIFGRPAVGHQLQELAPNIFVINLQSMDNFRDFVVKHLGFEKLFNKVFNNAIVNSLLKLLPALAEITFLGRIFYTAELAKNPQFDLVIVDAFASGHFYDLLTTPKAVINSGMVGPVLKETQKIERFFADAKNCATILVTLPQPLAISECLEFIPKLASTNLCPISTILVNRVPQPRLPATSSSSYKACDAFTDLAHSQHRESVQILNAGLKAFKNDWVHLRKFQTAADLGFIDEPVNTNFYTQLLSYPPSGEN